MELSGGKPYPACDNGAARAALAALYDNRRLLHAVEVSGVQPLGDNYQGRHCVAEVTWENGSSSRVTYEFYPSGRGSQAVLLWIDYNGGMLGPAF